CLQYLNAPFTF
nr:immunoglobulin light chain junction region [Macaca mulatta]MOX49640.1 immunoglobulin light chain junction region [Macaca mulatta]MOX49906.1 immunoglobulin light chain junction region [Macaca mulatta]MOX50186.1 immunoglobulin light chain junction region [Macaca mulatta]MOX50223.1 immunoglobulin light chain junction region [Macaca mulatta]